MTCVKCDSNSHPIRKGKKICRRCESDAALIAFHNKSRDTEWRKKRAEKAKKTRRQQPQRFMCAAAKKRAKASGLEYELNWQQIQIPDFCPVLGIPLFVGERQCDNSPTLDRLDNLKGYTEDNVRVISWRANTLKRDATLDELEKIVQYMRNNLKG